MLDDYLAAVSSGRAVNPWLTTIRDALKTGSRNEEQAETKYVCHLSTIPLMSSADESNFEKRFKEMRFHRHDACGNCNYDRPEGLKKMCPCPAGLENICYLSAIDGIGSLEGPTKDQRSICYCPDQTNILTDSYPARMREATGLTGWTKVTTADELLRVLKTTRWANCQTFKKKTEKWIRRAYVKYTGDFVKSMVAQTIYCINGLVVMAVLSNPAALDSYGKLSEHFCECFEEIFYSYLKERKFEGDGVEITGYHPVEELKNSTRR